MPRGNPAPASEKSEHQDFHAVDFNHFVDDLRADFSGKSTPKSVTFWPVEDKRELYVSLVCELFGKDRKTAEREYEERISNQFKAAAQPEPMAHPEPLTIPEGPVEKYQGKSKSGEIYAFLLRVYAYQEGREPLTLGSLRNNDPIALKAFHNRQRSATIPDDRLLILSDPRDGTKYDSLLEHHLVDLQSPEGIKDAKKLMSAISHRLYPRY